MCMYMGAKTDQKKYQALRSKYRQLNFLQRKSKKRRRFEMKQAIERSRKNQIERIHKEKDNKKKEEFEFAEFWKLRNEELAIAEQQEREEER